MAVAFKKCEKLQAFYSNTTGQRCTLSGLGYALFKASGFLSVTNCTGNLIG